MPDEHPWLRRVRGGEPARARLVIFPPAGAGPARFRSWGAWNPDVDVVVAHLPAREERLGELGVTSIAEAGEACARALGRLGRRAPVDRTVVFGHSMGALVAVEAVRSLDASLQPAALVVSGCRAPHAAAPSIPLHLTPRRTLLRTVEPLSDGLTTPAESSTFIDYWEPILRSDLRLCWEYEAAPPPYVDAPLTAVAGQEDERVPSGALEDWAAYSTRAFTHLRFPGGHQYLFQAGASALQRLLADCLEGHR